jgi:RodZ C-terminal domain
MNRRTEERLEVYSPAKITLLDLPERELEGSLIDVSVSNMRLVLPEHLHAEQSIALEVETHLILGEVRYSTPRGSKFTVGAEPIHTLTKLSLPEGATRMEKIQALVDDFHHRLRSGLEAAESKPGTRIASGTAQVQRPQQLRGEAEQSATQSQGAALDARKATPETVQPAGDAPITNILETELPAANLIPEADSMRIDAQRRGLEEARLRNSVRRRAISIGVIAGLATLVAVALFARPTRGIDPPISKKVSADASVPKLATSPIPTATHTSTPANSTVLRMRASMKATETTWVSACSDGQKIFEGVVGLGQTKQIDFSGKAVVWVGNAGGMEIALDGRPIGSLGNSGQGRVIQLGREGFRFLEINGATESCLAD